jgi:hypothetical protein
MLPKQYHENKQHPDCGPQPWHDKGRLKRLYHDKRMSIHAIADELNTGHMVIHHWMKKHNIERRGRLETTRTIHPTIGWKDGYRYAGSHFQGKTNHVLIHDLIAIANGADSYELFGKYGNAVHHKNEMKCDNRPENLDVVKNSDHAKIHKFWEINNE